MTAVKHVPEGLHTITAHLICEGAADAIDFYKKAFDAVELIRMPGPNGKVMHAQLRIGDSIIMLADSFPEGGRGPKALNGSPVYLHMYVPDVDTTFAQAVAAGAISKMPVTDMFWGDRYGQLADPFGHNWAIATHTRDVTPEQMQQAMQQQPPSCE
jgi:PhnB protein